MKKLMNGVRAVTSAAFAVAHGVFVPAAMIATAMTVTATPAQAYGNCPGVYTQELVQGYWRCVRPWGSYNPCLEQYEWYVYDPRFGAFCVLR